jgi:anti-sigma-K factor RskA
MSDMDEMSCTEFADVAAELALGVLTGRERARAVAHLGHCDTCREDVRQLTVTGEELVGLLPAVEPPAGFESRVMDRLGLSAPAPAPARPARRLGRILSGPRSTGPRLTGWAGTPRRALAAAAVAVAVILAGVGGWGLHGASSSPAASPLASAPLLTASHQSAGQVFYYDTGSRWVYMSVDLPGSANGTVRCQVQGPDGQYVTVGSFQLTNGYGYWGSPVPASTTHPAGARLVTTTGAVLATAAFTTA